MSKGPGWLRIGPLGIGVLLAIAAGVAALVAPTHPPEGGVGTGARGHAPDQASMISMPAAPAKEPDPRPLGHDRAETRTGIASAPAAPSTATAPGTPRAGRSPLERSPGYFPPADPESASVRLGRREAPRVEGEFQGGGASLDDFARAVLDALNSRNERGLHDLRVTRREFETFLWREFPESRPITNITVDDAWGLSEPTSLSAASRVMGLLGGHSLRLVRVEHEEAKPYTNFELIRGVVIIAKEEGSGDEHRIKLTPSVAVRNGRFKALLFRD